MIKYELLDGCTHSSTINDKNFNEYTIKQRQKYLCKLIKTCTNEASLQNIFDELVMVTCSETEDLGYCDECGSYNTVFIKYGD